jgi:LDH2 family malate/lactate/ureidoglycolate dehydrogenase
VSGEGTVQPDALRELVTRILVARGVPDGDAQVVATITVDADLDGRASHGVARVPAFVEKLEHGGIDASAITEITNDHGAVFTIDGHAGFGQVALEAATRLALERSRQFGIACGTVRNTNNPGMLAAYGRMAIADHQIAIVACNAAPAMPPHGGTVAMLGTNPLCIALPVREGPPPLLDMATTAAAKGVIRDAARKGLPIPEGWALGPDGAPTTDPVVGLEGLLLPAGGAKGYGLALMIDLLAGLLSGGGVGEDIRGLHDQRPSGVSAIVITLDPAAFLSVDEFEGRLAGYLDAIRAVPPGPGVAEVMIPGDRAWRARERGMAEGMPVPAKLWDELLGLAGAS